MMPQEPPIDSLQSDARQIWRAGLDAVLPCNLFDRTLLTRITDAKEHPVTSRYILVGCGKAALAMSAALFATASENQDVMDPDSITGLITVPHGYRSSLPAAYQESPAIEVIEAGHPLPDKSSVASVNQTVDFLNAAQLTDSDCVVVFVSGGGSANWGAPVSGLELSDLNELTTSLLRADVDIIAMNSIRRLLTRFGGGGLLHHTGSARVVSVVISDVPGNDLGFVASGPTFRANRRSPDLQMLNALDISPAIRRVLSAQTEARGRDAESSTTSVQHLLLADNRTAVRRAMQYAALLGYATPGVLELCGDASVAGRYLANRSVHCSVHQSFALIAGGETTVTVRGDGLGGRNQEVALAAVPTLSLCTRDVVVLCAGTDGIDGPTCAAGGLTSNRTLDQLTDHGIAVEDALWRNDSFNALSRVGSLFRTGPTHTNVMDLAVVVTTWE